MKIFIVFSLFILLYCTSQKSIEEYKTEVLQSELAFAEMAQKQGVEKAFLTFADDDAVLNRNEKILKGQEAFKKYFSNPVWQKAQLDWKPDFVEVSASGDLAYTYGQYTFAAPDSNGNMVESRGIFHTVWKKQKNGSWKFVWD
jgi:ketosteroid isomerase-like protein